MLIGATKTVNHQNLRNRLYAGTQCLSYQISRILAARSLANFAYYCPDHPCRYRNLPYLEAQTR